jgi:membrane protease YdiL (CAAX protease family)
MLDCKNCSFFKSYFAVILITAVAVRFFSEYSALITVAVLTGIPTLLFNKSLEELGYRNFLRGFLWGILASAVVLPVFYFVFEKVSFSFEEALKSLPFFLGIAIGEETFFRGFFYATFGNENLLGNWLTKNNLVSSLLFGIAHALVYYDPSRFKVFFPSLVMGWLYERSGSLGAPIIFHCLSDVIYQFARV